MKNSNKHIDTREELTCSTWTFVKDLYYLTKGNRILFYTATILRIIGDLAWLYPPFAFASSVTFLSTYHRGDPLSPLLTIGVWWVIATFFQHASRAGARYVGRRVGALAGLEAQKRTILHLCRLDISWHERENTGNKLKRILKGSDSIENVFFMWIRTFIECFINVVGAILIITTFDIVIAGIMIFFLLSFFILSKYFVKHIARAENGVNISEENVHGLAFETLNNIRSVKVLGMATPLLSRFSSYIHIVSKCIITRFRKIFHRELACSLWGGTVRLSALGYIIYGVMEGRYAVGFLILFYNYFNKIWEMTDEISTVSQDFIVAKIAFTRMKKIWEEPILIDHEHGKQAFPLDWKTVTLRNVSFGYGNKSVLNKVSFQIRRGERIGIVGLSGAGKSTLFKLLLKEHENYSGEILVDNVPLIKIRRSSLFKKTAVVLQETEVFNFTLEENIALANQDQKNNVKLLERAIQTSYVSDFLKRLPKGLQTLIGEKGVKLSGGEKQRLGIARAVFKDPQILFMDEATSHLDLESEKKIRDSLHRFFQNVTAIVIAHRLSTIQEMDRILVLDKGRIVETGNFSELMAKNGVFARLWRLQKI